MALILDTNAVSDLLAGNEALSRILSQHAQHHLPVIVIAEYRFGLLRSRHRPQLLAWFEDLIKHSVVLVIDLGTVDSYVQLRDDLRSRGRPIPENDVWIAALARQHGLPLASRDSHFDEVEGIQRLSW